MFKENNNPLNETNRSTHEEMKGVVVPPPEETLLYPDTEGSLWPEEIRNNPELRAQAEARRELAEKLDSLFATIPATTEIKEAIEQNLVSPESTAQIYNALSNFLEADSANERILLYIPFELIPDNSWKPESEALQQAMKRFEKTYMETWQKLLPQHDFRANFVDGDIPEPGVSPQAPVLVSKAAHMIPLLTQKGYLTSREAVTLAEKSTDLVLKNSILDTLPVLAGMDLFTHLDFEYMKSSQDDLVYNSSIIIQSQQGHSEQKPLLIRDQESFQKLFETFDETLAEKIAIDPTVSEKAPARAKWLKEVSTQTHINEYAREVANALEANIITEHDIESLLLSSKQESQILTGITALREFGEKTGRVSNETLNMIEAIWNTEGTQAKEIIKSTWLRWNVLGIIDTDYLEKHGISRPKLEGAFFEKSPTVIDEAKRLAKVAETIKNDPELTNAVYPATLLYGSKVKGYDIHASDVDYALFIKPEIAHEQSDILQKKLTELFDSKQKNHPALFWLDHSETGLQIKNLERPGQYDGGSMHANVLFEGAWCGDKEATNELYQSLLPGYIYSKDKKIFGSDARAVWLGSLERAQLQYRLLHHGYARSNPPHGGIETPHGAMIDSESSFWDSGYRRLATKLFITKVFLPQLDK